MTAVVAKAFLTAKQKRFLKQMNKVAVPPELFGVAADAVKAMHSEDIRIRDLRGICMLTALKKRGVDLLAPGHLVSAIMFRVEAFGRTIEQMSMQEVKRLGGGGTAATWRILVAGATEPLVLLVGDNECEIAFDLDSFRRALTPEPSFTNPCLSLTGGEMSAKHRRG